MPGPERVRRGASTAPLPRQGPAAGTMSPVLDRPLRAPRSGSVNSGAKASVVGKGTTKFRKADRSIESHRTGRGAAHHAGPRDTPERHAAGHNQGTRTCAKQQRPPGVAKPGQRAQHATNQGTRTGARQHQPPSRWTCPHRAADPAPAGYGTAAVRMDQCVPNSVPSTCRLRNWRRPDGRVRSRRVHSPCRLLIAAVRTDECAPRSDAPHRQHNTPGAHTGEQEPRGPGHGTHNTQHNTSSEHTAEQEPRGRRHRTRNTTG